MKKDSGRRIAVIEKSVVVYLSEEQESSRVPGLRLMVNLT